MFIRIMITTLVVVATAATAASAQRSDTLPTVIATAFHQSYPKATILHSNREMRAGKVVYEIESQDGPMRRDLIYDLEGRAVEIEDILPADSVPAAVRAGVERDWSGATILGGERVTADTVVRYEVRARKDGRTRLLTYDPEGARKP